MTRDGQLSDETVEWLGSLSRHRRSELVKDLARSRDLALYQSIDLVAEHVLSYALHPEDEDGWPQYEAEDRLPPGAAELYKRLQDADVLLIDLLRVLDELGVEPPPEPPWWRRVFPWS